MLVGLIYWARWFGVEALGGRERRQIRVALNKKTHINVAWLTLLWAYSMMLVFNL